MSTSDEEINRLLTKASNTLNDIETSNSSTQNERKLAEALNDILGYLELQFRGVKK